MSVSLIIPVRNEAAQVDSTMAAIKQSTIIPDQIIIADGQSEDDTVDRFLAWNSAELCVEVVENPLRWSGSGRNIGARKSTGDILVFADCGNPISATWIDEITRPLRESDEVDIVCGVFQPLVENEFHHTLAAIHYPVNYEIDNLEEAEQREIEPQVILPGGGAIAMRRSTFEAVGGYPEWLHRAQDKLFSRKAYAVGMRVYVNWAARMHHHMRSRTQDVFQLTFDYGRGNGRTKFVNWHFLKLLGFYGGVSIVMVVGLLIDWRMVLLSLLLLAAYLWHAGVRKVASRGEPDVSRRSIGLSNIAAVLFARDAGVICGHIWGFGEWLLRRRFRTEYYRYMASCDPRRIPHIEN